MPRSSTRPDLEQRRAHGKDLCLHIYWYGPRIGSGRVKVSGQKMAGTIEAEGTRSVNGGTRKICKLQVEVCVQEKVVGAEIPVEDVVSVTKF